MNQSIVMLQSPWAVDAARIVSDEIAKALAEKDGCSVMLTGGRAAKAVYHELAKSALLVDPRIRFFQGDERCVARDSTASNQYMCRQSLFADPEIDDPRFHFMCVDSADKDAACKAYADLVPEHIDVLLLSVGEDGHIASLFPMHSALDEDKRTVVPVEVDNEFPERFTVTANVIKSAKSVLIFGVGSAKGKVLSEARDVDDANKWPVLIAQDAYWLVDENAARALNLVNDEAALYD